MNTHLTKHGYEFKFSCPEQEIELKRTFRSRARWFSRMAALTDADIAQLKAEYKARKAPKDKP